MSGEVRSMSSIQKQVVDEFCRRLEKTEGFTETMVRNLRDLFGNDRKPKPTDVMKVLAASSTERIS